MTVIAVANQKGGVGKTTSVVNLGAALQEQGKRVLVVDFDPQASLTVHLGLTEPESLPANCGHVLWAAATGNRQPTLRDVLVRTPAGLDLIPSGRQLSVAEFLLHTVLGRELILRDCLAPLRAEYEYILIDCLPTSNILVANALAAADAILVPVQADYLATQGLAQILQTVATIRERLNPRIEVLGILLTMVDVRTAHSRQVIGAVRRSFEGKLRVFDTMIKLQVGFKESSRAGTSVLGYDTRSASARAYRDLAREVIAANAELRRALDAPAAQAEDQALGAPVGSDTVISLIEDAAVAAMEQSEQLARDVRKNGANRAGVGAHLGDDGEPAKASAFGRLRAFFRAGSAEGK